jgi:signal transduction histidine kinase
MKKVALVFIAAVFVPSLVLAWLAVRSLRDQQFVLERQQSLLLQGVADAKAREVQDALAGYQHEFSQNVGALLGTNNTAAVTRGFDSALPRVWPLAQLGFVVSLDGELISPNRLSVGLNRKFYEDNGRFLSSRESAEVYASSKLFNNSGNNFAVNNAGANIAPPGNQFIQNSQLLDNNDSSLRRYGSSKAVQARSVTPQQPAKQYLQPPAPEENLQQASKLSVSEAEFRQLIGDESEGALARFVDNKLNLLFWNRPPADRALVFGAKIDLPRLISSLQPLVADIDPAWRSEVCVALLDDNAKPVALSQNGFRANWKRPFVATEIGDALPHWEVAVYLLDPSKLSQSARTVQLTLGLLIAILLLAIGVGSFLIVGDLKRQLSLARQKTDFVSNVSHELKTPLTSIRMFSELLSDGRVTDPQKQHAYLAIISAETARLTRLINNVLDFARIDRGEKKYHFRPCDLSGLVREIAETYRPNLETNGFKFDCSVPEAPVWVNADRDAISQVVVNLLSNAEKYSDTRKEIALALSVAPEPVPGAEIRVLDRGIGIPRGAVEKIFEQFYRVHDSLANGVTGSGLGLTLARQIARAHAGDVTYEPRAGGGSTFIFRLSLVKPETPSC